MLPFRKPAPSPAQMRERLFRSSVGSLHDWEKPDVREGVGPYEPEVFDSYDNARRQVVQEVRAKLDAMPDTELQTLTDRQSEGHDSLRRSWEAFVDDSKQSLPQRPPWYAGGFNVRHHAADREHWARMPNFTIHELLCLSAGVEPTSFDQKVLEKNARGNPETYWSPMQFLLKRRELLNRKFLGYSVSGKVDGAGFSTWCSKVDFEADQEFLELLRRYHGLSDDGVRGGIARHPAKTPQQREIDKIAQLFTAMAIELYGFDRFADRSPTPREITNLAASMGISVHEDTVRKYLGIGAKFIPKDWKPE
ncbi:hypothetical protein [Pelagovum pacificum]|uniref:Uncharacterized protein n=1 Tax=Pelagovum pacificum TaxID=2588711 RepID=A0A5C5G7J3_9RHOB|nr:hypothetical protein [Pelagovum pacificum]QQA41478.1 hypothetical protein I8N54_11625 [Pelagovum pacificum]TNY30521.1 hypothetical protein FHY64_19885 [Pelagovum pacificum]